MKGRIRNPRIPVNAMSDIGFLLLIFIMLVSLINYRQEIPIDYPEARAVELTDEEDNFEIWIPMDGRIFISGEAVSLAEMENRVVESFLETPSQRIHILADRNTPYRFVHQVVDILQLLEHRVVSFVVEEG